MIKRKRKISAAGRAAIIAGVKARWARYHKLQANGSGGKTSRSDGPTTITARWSTEPPRTRFTGAVEQLIKREVRRRMKAAVDQALRTL